MCSLRGQGFGIRGSPESLIPIPDSLRLHLFPPTGFRGAFHGIEHRLITCAVAEVRLRQFPLIDGGEEIVNGVDERVLVTNDVPGGPPGADVRVFRLRHQDGLVGLQSRGFVAVEEFQFVHALHVVGQTPLATVDLEGVAIPAATGESRRLENPHASVFEARQEIRVVIHGDLAPAFLAFSPPGAGTLGGQRPVLDEGRHLARQGLDFAIQVLRQVSGVRADIPEGAAAGKLRDG